MLVEQQGEDDERQHDADAGHELRLRAQFTRSSTRPRMALCGSAAMPLT